LGILNGKITPAKKAKKQAAAFYARSLITEGEDVAFSKLLSMAKDTTNFSLSENDMNNLGYEFYNDHKIEFALQSLRAGVYIFPNSDNLFNSYAEILAKAGKKEAAILMYKKSLLLNPKNEDSQKALIQLER